MIILFLGSYLLIALENQTGINKTAVSLVAGIVLWTLYIFSGFESITGTDPLAFHDFILQNPVFSHLSPLQQAQKYVINSEIIDQLGNIAEILFYLLGAMTIVEVIDLHHGFTGITNSIKTRSKKKLLWLIAILTFFMSSVLDNMTSAIIMMTLIQKLLDNQRERWIFGSVIIIAANAGGVWTPIGDVTTIMLWINDNISSAGVIKNLFLPSIVSLLIPVFFLSLSLKGNTTASPALTTNIPPDSYSKSEQNNTLIIGLCCLIAVPVFKALTGLPPFAGILLMLGILWVYTDILYKRKKNPGGNLQHPISYALSKIDFSTILFFFGILMAVGALEAIGILHQLSDFLNTRVHNIYFISSIIGFLSSIIDNVPLVAAAMGMYPIVTSDSLTSSYMLNFIPDGHFWQLIAYCAGTGGSILIIGSAAGVVVMGLEKINFIWYLKHITWLTLLGFLAGIGIYYLQNQIFA